MTKAKQYRNKFLILLIVGLSFYSGLRQLNWLDISPLNGLFVVGFVFILFLVGTLIIAPGIDKGSESFVQRFFILTTIQMMTFLFMVVALVYSHFPEAKTVVMHMLILMLFYLMTQSFLLVRFSKN